MSKKYLIISIVLISLAVIFGSLTGFPIPTEIETGGCKAVYQRYLFPRFLCQYLTSGHCATTGFNKYNAEIEIARCLCDKYLDQPNDKLQNQILQKCDLVKPDCRTRVEMIKTDYCNKAGLNSLECREYFDEKYTQDIEFICRNKNEIFYKIFID